MAEAGDLIIGQTIIFNPRPDQYAEPQQLGKLPRNQVDTSYPNRSLASFLEARGPLCRTKTIHITRISAPNLDRNSLLDQRSYRPLKIKYPKQVEMIYSTTGQGSQRTREQTETKRLNQKLALKINHSKLRCLNIRVRTQYVTARVQSSHYNKT